MLFCWTQQAMEWTRLWFGWCQPTASPSMRNSWGEGDWVRGAEGGWHGGWNVSIPHSGPWGCWDDVQTRLDVVVVGFRRSLRLHNGLSNGQMLPARTEGKTRHAGLERHSSQCMGTTKIISHKTKKAIAKHIHKSKSKVWWICEMYVQEFETRSWLQINSSFIQMVRN